MSGDCELIFGDCLIEMPKLIKRGIKVDMILCDLPYGVTKNKWDCPIPLDKLWLNYNQLIKDNGAIVLFGQDKFSAQLMLSNEKHHRYNLIWQKTSPTGHLNAKKMPMRSHEDILVFYKKLPTYNPQKTTGHKRKVSTAKHKRNSKKTTNYGDHKLTSYDSTERYPTSVITLPTDKQKSPLHPTQKPVDLFYYLIKTYTNQNDLVLDNTMGSGSTAIACLKSGRKFIGIEDDQEIFPIAKNRIDAYQSAPKLFQF